jgi:hypothetical protein
VLGSMTLRQPHVYFMGCSIYLFNTATCAVPIHLLDELHAVLLHNTTYTHRQHRCKVGLMQAIIMSSGSDEPSPPELMTSCINHKCSGNQRAAVNALLKHQMGTACWWHA